METIEVEKVLLHTDSYELKQAKARAKEAETALNAFAQLVGKELKRKLEPEEMEAVKNDALGWLESSLTFPLVHAPEKMRYDALGIDIWLIKEAWGKRTWGADRRGRKWEFTLEGNVFKLKEDQPLFQAHYKYAAPGQLEILEQSKALADALNVAAEQGLNIIRASTGNSVPPMHKLKDLFPVVRYRHKDQGGEFTPDLEYISRLKI